MTARPRAAVSWSGGKDSLAAVAATRDQFDARLRSDDVRRDRPAQPLARIAAGARRGAGGPARSPVRDGAVRVVHLRRRRSPGALRDWRRTGSPTWCSATWCIRNTASGRRRGARRPDSRPWSRCSDWTPARCSTRSSRPARQALMVTVREPWLDESWLGRPLSAGMKEDFDARGIDPCGERGEYHTAVVDSPLFSRPITRHARGSACAAASAWRSI